MPSPLLPRRAALSAALGSVVVITGCELPRPPREVPPAPPRPAGTAPVEGADPDTDLVQGAVAELTTLAALVTAVRRQHGSLRADLGGLHRALRVQIETLQPAGPAAGSALPPAPAIAQEALFLVDTNARRAQRRTATWAVAAESGALARLLGAISAGLGQQTRLLPRPPADDGPTAVAGGAR